MTNDDDDELTVQARGRVGQVLSGKWTLGELVGVGGWAAVYKAVHRNGATSAIKVLHPQVSAHQETRERFLREAYIANKVGHPGTVSVFDDDVDASGAPYIVMELLDGETLDARAARARGVLPLEEVVTIADQVLAVLEAAHEKGIVHRDLKPDNLFLTTSGVIKVLDFGIARLRDSTAASRTKTGTMIGTPGFMSPEQAMGRTSEIDGRTDLWALGATMFSLLTGEYVHEGESVHEMLVHAATRPARSLARALPDAPIGLVQLIDRALEYDKQRRYADARRMRADLARLVTGGHVSVGGLTSRPPVSHGAAILQRAPTQAHPVSQPIISVSKPTRDASSEARNAIAGYDLAFDTSASDTNATAMRDLFTLMEKAIVAKTQYGPNHPETARRFERLLSHTLRSLAQADDGLVWSVNPYSFLAGTESLWEPEPPLNRIPYQLFSDGIRLMGLLPGLIEEELTEFIRILTIDPVTELPPEDDLVTLLWDAGLDHVVHVAIDPFAEGDQQARARFERARQTIMREASADTREELQSSWKASTRQRVEGAASARSLAKLLATRDITADAEATARAARLELPDAPGGADVVRVPAAVREVLAAKMTPDTVAVGEHFVVAAAHAFTDAEKRGGEATVTMPLRASVDGLAKNAPEAGVEYVIALCNAIEGPDAERLRTKLAGGIVSRDTMRALLASKGLTRALATILGYLDDTHLQVVLDALDLHGDDPELRRAMIDYVARVGRGHEAALGALLPRVGEEIGVALVRLLGAYATPASRDAIAEGAHSPHAVVRIEALGHLEGVSSERLRLELRSLLEDRELSVRLAALRAMAKYRIRVAGPFLVLRVRSQRFDSLPIDERREALSTLATLAPARAEAVARDLLGDANLIPSDAHEQSRALAAEVLGSVGSGSEVIAALTKAAKNRLRGSERVRQAAAKALEQVTQRAASANRGGG